MQAAQPGLILSMLRILLPISNILERVGLQWFVTRAVRYAVRNYQRYISPYKGFSCAYRVLHGGESCSEHFRQLVATDNLSQAVSQFQQRLGDCRQAHHLLRLQRQQAYAMEGAEPAEEDVGEDDRQRGDNRRRSSSSTDWCSGFNGCGGWGSSDTHSSAPCDTNHNGVCDVGDCSGVDIPDIGGCDCNF